MSLDNVTDSAINEEILMSDSKAKASTQSPPTEPDQSTTTNNIDLSSTHKNNSTVDLDRNSSLGVLNWSQVSKLDNLMDKYVPIHGRGNFPTLNVRLKDFIRNLHRRLVDQCVRVKDIRINGGVASHILAKETNYEFSDIDIIYSVDLLQLSPQPGSTSNPNKANEEINNSGNSSFYGTNLDLAFSNTCDIIKNTVFNCLLDYFPPNSQVKKENVSSQCLKEAYVKKMVKIYKSASMSTTSEREPYDPDESMESQQSTSRWSLISLCNDEGQNIELKFVDKMKRQFQFSVDAFQVHLNSLLDYYDCQDSMRVLQVDCATAATKSTTQQQQASKMTENVYPTVIAESMYGEFEESNYHLNNKLIATKSPEEIRGGGLLKYCNLLIKGYRPLPSVETQMHTMEKYMCSRFFIDFSDLTDQEHKLNAYLDCHFQNSPHMCSLYLEKLFDVVDSSTVCLMGHERKQTLNLIKSMAQRFQQQKQQIIIKTTDNDNSNNKNSSNANNNNNNQSTDDSYCSHPCSDDVEEEVVIDSQGNVLNKSTDFINDSNSNHTIRPYLEAQEQSNKGTSLNSSSSSNLYYQQQKSNMGNTGSNAKSPSQYMYSHNNSSSQQMYIKQQHQHQNQMYYLNQQYHHQHANSKSQSRYNHPISRSHRKTIHNNNNRHKFSEVQIKEQEHSTRGDNTNQSQSESVSPFLSSSPLQTNSIFINKASLNPLHHHPHHANTGHHIKSNGLIQTEQSLFSSSVSSLSSSSVSSSVVSSPSPSPSPPIGPFYMPLNSSEDSEAIDLNTETSSKTTEDPKPQFQPQDSSKIFQCKISSQSYPYIEVFYNCYAPPVLSAPVAQSLLTLNQQQQQLQQQQPVIIHYQTPPQQQPQQQQPQLLSSKSSSASSSPVYFYHNNNNSNANRHNNTTQPQQMMMDSISSSYSSCPSTTTTSTQLTFMVPKFYVNQNQNHKTSLSNSSQK